MAAALMSAATLAAAVAQEPPEKPEPVIIPGQVFDHLGAGVERMSVLIYRVEGGKAADEVLAQTSTDRYGDFSLELPAGSQGTFLVRIAKKGYMAIEREVELLPDRPVPFVDAQSTGALKLEGRVKRSSDESPIAGAEVTVSDGYGTWTGTCDRKGRFVVEGIPPEAVTVKVEAKGFATVRQELPVMSEAEPIEIWMEPGWSAVVEIVDPQGIPLPQVTVEALSEQRERLRTEVTDENGEARFTGLGPETRRLQLRFTHFALPRAEEFEQMLFREGPETKVRERYQVVLAARVKGVIRDAKTGQPVYSARVMAGDYVGGGLPKTWSDAEGKYSLPQVQPGRVVLTVHHAEYAPSLVEIDIGSGQTKTVDFELAPGRKVHGRVVDEQGQPIAQAQVLVTFWRGFETAGMATLTDEQGRFEFEHAPPEPFEVAASRSGYLSQAKEAGANNELRLELASAEVGAGRHTPAGRYGAGDPVPELAFKTLKGQEFSLSGLRGKVVLLDFWATWCGPCLDEIPRLKEVYATFGKREDFVMLGISLDRSESQLEEFIKERKLGWPQVFDGRGWDSGAARSFGIQAIPSTFLIDQQGQIAAVNLRGEALTEHISRLLE